MPIRTPDGYLDITNATLRGSEIITTSKVGIANSAPTHTLSVGNKLFVDDSAANVLTVSGNLVATSLKIGQIDLAPSYALEHVANVGNTISNVVQFTNTGTGFVSASNVGIGTTTTPAGLLDVVGSFRMRYQDMGVTKAHIITGANSTSIAESGGVYTYTRAGSSTTGNFLPNPSNIVPKVGQRYRVKLTARSDYAGTIRYECPTSTIITTYDLTASFKEYTWDFTATGTTMQFAVTTASGTTSQFNAFSIERLGVGFNVNPTSTTAPIQFSGVTHFSDNVGIGTASPRWSFEVTPTSGLGGVLSCSDSPIFSHNLYYSGGWKYGAASTGGAYMRMIDSEVQFWNAPNSGSGTWDTAGGTATTTQRMTIVASGNVGIGTASPGVKLQVGSSAETTPQYIEIRGQRVNAAGDICGIQMYNSAVSGGRGNSRITNSRGANNYGSNLEFWTNPDSATAATEKMRITSTGNVGIGTVTPQEKFHLYGSPIIEHETRYTAAGSAGWYKIGTWNAASATGARLKISLLGCEGYGAQDGNRGGETFIYASINNNNPTTVSNMSGSIHAQGNPIITHAKFKQVGADRTQYEIIAYVRTYTQHTMKIECSETTTFTRAWTSASDPGADSATVQAALFTHVVNNSGNVGIGTQTPGVQLHIQGPSPISLGTSNGPSYSNYGQLVITDTTAPSGTAVLGNLKIGFDASTGSFGTGFLQCVNPNTYSGPFCLQPYGGYVGIGTVSPLQKLHVNGNHHNPVIYMADPTNNRYASGMGTAHVNGVGQRLDFYNGDSGANGTSLSSSHIRMSINASGNVGIGTLSPGSLLTTESTSGNHMRLNYNADWYNIIERDSTGDLNILEKAGASASLVNLMTIKTGGNVGIGTATPGCKLHVNGAICLEAEDIGQFGADGISDQAQRNKTYIKFGHGGTDNDWAYLRQIGASNQNHIAIDFHDDGNDSGFSIRDVTSTNHPDTVTTRFKVERGGNVGIDDDSPTHKFTVANRHGIEADGHWARYRIGTGQSNNFRIYFRSSSMNSSAGGGADNVEMHVNNLYSGNDASDDRIKTDEVLVENATQTLLKLKPQTYTKDIFEFDELTSEEYSNTESSTDGYVFSPTHDRWRKRRFAGRPKKETGLIVQDIWYDAPELRHIIHLADDAEPAEERPNIEDIQQDPDYDALGWGLDASHLRYQQLIPYLIKSNQEIYTELQAEKSKTATLETKTAALETKTAALETETAALETKLQEAEAKITTLQAERDAMRSDLSSLVLRVTALES